MNGPFPLPSRAHNMSPASFGSEWSGGNTFSSTGRSDSPFGAYMRGDTGTPDPGGPGAGFPFRQNGYGPPPSGTFQHRRPSESGSRNSSRVPSLANSRSSDGTISDQQSRKYRRMEMELAQHYTVLRQYLRGGSQQPPRPNKARDKLLRLSPVQFHELSTDVFDELQRRQAMAPLPGRPPRRDNVPPFLQPRPDFHEKRNQARQKLSSLQTTRFKDLATDVFCELERRFPQFNKPDSQLQENVRSQSRGPGDRPSGGLPGPNGYLPPPRANSQGQSINNMSLNPYGNAPFGGATLQDNSMNPPDHGRPMPKQFQSNTITPNKSMMVEDEDELQGVDSKHDRSSDAFGLESSLTSPRSNRDTPATSQSIASSGLPAGLNQSKITELQDQLTDLRSALKAKDDELQRMQFQQKPESVNQELERKLTDAEARNGAMRQEMARIQALQSNRELDEQLKKKNQSLQDRLKHQEEIINDVRRQGQLHLEEMRAMAESGGGNLEREDQLQAQVGRLEDEVKEWKAKYIRAKTQLRNVRAGSLGLSIGSSDLNRSARDTSLYDKSGAVKDIHVTKFQISIDELLRIARSDDPTAVLDHMKTVVLAVRNITTDIENTSSLDKDEDATKKRSKLKTKISATANNVITASKNYAAAGGLSPVSLLDAAASHLTTAVVDLVKTVKIRPTPAGEVEDDDDGILEPLQSNGYFDVSKTAHRRSAVESIYSALSSPDDGVAAAEDGQGTRERSGTTYTNGSTTRNGLGIKTGLKHRNGGLILDEHKMFIDDQSDQLIESIQILIEAIRREEPTSNILNNISRITDTVESIVTASDKASNERSWFQDEWHEQAASTTQTLHECKVKLLQASDELQEYDDQALTKTVTQQLPPLAFQVARETRELVRRIHGIKTADGDDDFS